MRILIYSHFFFPSVGGVEKLTYLMARYIQEAGHEVTVVTRTPACKEGSWPFRLVRCPSLRRLAQEIRRSDVVHMQGFVLLPILISKINGRPLVWAHHGYDLTCPKIVGWREGHDATYKFRDCARCLLRDHSPHGTLALLILFHVKRALRRIVDAHVAPSRYVLTHEGLDGAVIPNAVDTDAYAPNQSLKEPGLILFLGRLIHEKGATVLIRAFGRLASRGGYRLRIVGGGYEQSYLRSMVSEMGLDGSVSFSTAPLEQDVVKEIQRASVVCAPTLSAEAFGIVGLEAMACGTPLVVSDKGGFKEFATGVAYLVPPGDEEALAEALQRACSDPHVAHRTEEGRRRAVCQYDYRVVGRAYLGVYEGLVSAREGRNVAARRKR